MLVEIESRVRTSRRRMKTMRIVTTRDVLAERKDSQVELDRGMSCLIRVNFRFAATINIGSNPGATRNTTCPVRGTRRL
jgi:hypothetical protein